MPSFGNENSSPRTANTEHFTFHYPQALRPYAERMAQILETVHDTLHKRYDIQFEKPVEAIVTNSLMSSGYANPAQERVSISITDWGFQLRGTQDWLRNVVTHEFSHIVSLHSGQKWPSWLLGFHLGFSDYRALQKQYNANLMIPARIMPIWFIEGIAQYETTRLGFDQWDAFRDMVIRVAAQNDSLRSLAEMQGFVADRDIDWERGPYTQGFALVQYIGQKWGDQALVDIWKKYQDFLPYSFGGALESVLKITEEDLYKEWVQWEKSRASERLSKNGKIVQGRKRTKNIYGNANLKMDSQGNLWGLSNFGADSWEQGVFSLNPQQLKDSTLELTPLNMDSTDAQKIYPARGFDVDFNAKGEKILAWATYRNRDSEDKARFDIVLDKWEKGDFWGARKSSQMQTQLQNAVHPAIHVPSGRLVYARREDNSGRFVLETQLFDQNLKPQGESQVLLRAPADTFYNYSIYKLDLSPNGQNLVFDLFDGRQRYVLTYNFEKAQMAYPPLNSHDLRDASWDGDSAVVFSANNGGIFNIYRWNTVTNTVKRLTNVPGGAFSPVVQRTDSASVVWYVNYDQDGFSLYSIAEDTSPELPIEPAFKKLPRYSIGENAWSFIGSERNYRSIPNRLTLTPSITVARQSSSTRGTEDPDMIYKVGVHVSASDPLEKNTFMGGINVEVGKTWKLIKDGSVNPAVQKDIYLAWQNKSFPITIDAMAAYRNLRFTDTLKSEDPNDPESRLTEVGANFFSGLVSGKYSLWKQGDSIAVNASYMRGAFDLYETGFGWNFYTAYQTSLDLSWQSETRRYAPARPTTASGIQLGVNLSREWADLFKSGAFHESFVIDKNSGLPVPSLRDWVLDRYSANFSWGWDVPWIGARLGYGTQLQGVFHWEAPSDTLDDFFMNMVYLNGYPQYVEDAVPLVQGQHSWVHNLHLDWELWNKKRIWGLFIQKSAWLSLQYQAARAIRDGDFRKGFSSFEHRDWLRSVSTEFRLSNTIFNSIPLEFYFRMSHPLDKICYQNKCREVEPVFKLFTLSKVPIGAIYLGVGFDFWKASDFHFVRKNEERF